METYADKTTMQELLPFCRELLSQRPGRGMLKIYLLGSAVAALGSLLGLVEAVCHPFTTGGGGDEPADAEMTLLPLLTAGVKRRTGVLEDEERERRGRREEMEVEAAASTTDHVAQFAKPHLQQMVRTRSFA